MRRKVRAALLALALFAGAGTQASAGKQETAYTAWEGSAEKDAEPGTSAGKQEIAYTAWEGSAEKDAEPGTSAGKQETAYTAEMAQEKGGDVLEDGLQQFRNPRPLGDDYTTDGTLKKTGYHLEKQFEVDCQHTVMDQVATVYCDMKDNLKPGASELKSKIKLTGKLMGKPYTARVKNCSVPGTSAGSVAGRKLEITLNVPGTGVSNLTLAEPYLCPDGYAAYTYYQIYFAYCEVTGKFYELGSSHVWHGCARGDVGYTEYNFGSYRHAYTVYLICPNQYKVNYNANGGTGTVAYQTVKYDNTFVLRKGSKYKREGYSLTGWNTKPDGTGVSYGAGRPAKNLTADQNGTVTLYAQWKANTLSVRYDANGASVSGTPSLSIASYVKNWDYETAAADPEDISTFGLTRTGWRKKDGAEWNTKPDGTGTSFGQSKAYAMTTYAPGLRSGNQSVTLYAQWERNTYAVTLDNRLSSPEEAGTAAIYEKYGIGWYFDKNCASALQAGNVSRQISIPKKKGYVFQGYYDSVSGGRQMIDAQGKLTGAAAADALTADSTWHARYQYLVSCEDYADVPCGLGTVEGDARADDGTRLTYDSRERNVSVSGKAQWGEIQASLEAYGKGKAVGMFVSTEEGRSIYFPAGSGGKASVQAVPKEGAAYRLAVRSSGREVCGRDVYFKGGKFRTLAKLGDGAEKEAQEGGTAAGSDWGTSAEAYGLYQYRGCSEEKKIQSPVTVFRYFSYRDVNVAYSGNGATSGKNVLETGVSLENDYQVRGNSFARQEMREKRTASGRAYRCLVDYGFRAWRMSAKTTYLPGQREDMRKIYAAAKEEGALLDRTAEDPASYQKEQAQTAGSTWPVQPEGYVNFLAEWDAYPTIVVTPGEKMEFYEGEEVTKEELVSRLTAHDDEDNDLKDADRSNDTLNDKVKIAKISYPATRNGSQRAYEKEYHGGDVPEGFLLDTYYLKLEKDEQVEARVTFTVTDSGGRTTRQEVPVTVKYNYAPKISSEDVFYYLKEEVNRGLVTEEALLGRASAEDKEDGDITGKLELDGIDLQELKMQKEAKAEFLLAYRVTDAYRKTARKNVRIAVWDEEALEAEAPKSYVRYISGEYLDTLEENSVWREPENQAYLQQALGNGTPRETWEFTREDVLAVQEWTAGGGRWKNGQEANREFLRKFARCLSPGS